MSSVTSPAIKLLPGEQVGMLADGFSRIVDDHSPASRSDDFFAADHDALWRALHDGGWFALGLPEDAGGAGCDLRDLLELAEIWGASLLPIPFAPTMLLSRWRGRVEADAGGGCTFSLPAQEGGGLVPFGARAGIRVLDGGGQLVPASDGFTATAVDDFAPSLPLATSASPSSLEPRWRDELRAWLAAEAVGSAQGALDGAIEYAGQRKAYGQPIGRFQAIKHLLADMKRDVELGRSAAVWAAQVSGAESARAAAAGVQRCQQATAGAIQVFAGIGFTWELDLHFRLRHALAVRRMVGRPDAG